METAVTIADVLQKLLTPISLLVTAWLGYLVYRATTDAPINAAKVAADLNSESIRRSEQERRRMYIFVTLMGARRSVYSAEVTTAFNLIDVVFHDKRPVREAWADLYSAYKDQRLNTPHGHALRDEKLNTLLFQMAQVLEIGSDLRLEDINRVYIPDSLHKQALIEMHQRDRLFSELQESPEADKSAIPSLFAPSTDRRG